MREGGVSGSASMTWTQDGIGVEFLRCSRSSSTTRDSLGLADTFGCLRAWPAPSRTRPLTLHIRERLGELSGEDEEVLMLVTSDWLESDSSNKAVDAKDDIDDMVEWDAPEGSELEGDSPNAPAGCRRGVLLYFDCCLGGGVGKPIGRSGPLALFVLASCTTKGSTAPPVIRLADLSFEKEKCMIFDSAPLPFAS